MKKMFFTFLTIYTAALMGFEATIPVLDLQEYQNENTKEQFLNELESAMRDVGFFALVNTGVKQELLDKAYDATKDFFAKPENEKFALLKPELNGQRGYFSGESAKGDTRVDMKEFYHVGSENSGLPNVWPKTGEFEEHVKELYSRLNAYIPIIGSAISEVLGQEKNFISDMTVNGDNLMRILHYPANPPKDAIWGAEHTDIDLFTILPRATARGLQVKDSLGNWVDVIVPNGAFIINVGDMLENLSNGLCKSSVHRIVDVGEGCDRYSIVHFVHPKSSDRLDPLAYCIEKSGGKRKYANVNRYELLSERLIDLGLACSEMMQEFVLSGAIERLKEVDRFSKKAEKVLKEKGLL